jgi:hypothetical protein
MAVWMHAWSIALFGQAGRPQQNAAASPGSVALASFYKTVGLLAGGQLAQVGGDLLHRLLAQRNRSDMRRDGDRRVLP